MQALPLKMRDKKDFLNGNLAAAGPLIAFRNRMFSQTMEDGTHSGGTITRGYFSTEIAQKARNKFMTNLASFWRLAFLYGDQKIDAAHPQPE